MSDLSSSPPAPPAPEPGPGSAGASAAPIAPDESSIRPGKVWYWIGAVVLVLGTIGAIAWFTASIIGIATAADDYARVPLDSSRSLTFNETGSYLVFVEVASNVTSSTVIAEPNVTVTDGAGASVTVQTYYGSNIYNTGGHHGQAFGRIEITSPGTYTVEVGPRGSGTAGRAPIGIAIGKDFPASGAVGIIGSMMLGLVAFVAGIVILVVTGVRRGRSRRRLFPPVPKYPPMAYPGGYRPGPYGPPPGPYGAPPPGPYGAPPPGPYGAPPPGPYGAPPPGPYGAPPPGPYGPPPGPYGPPPGPYGAPRPGPYPAPPPQGPPSPFAPPADGPPPRPGAAGDDASDAPAPPGPWPRPGSGGG